MFEDAVAGVSGPAAAEIRSLTRVLVVLGTVVFAVFAVLFVRAMLRRGDADDRAGSKLIFWGGVAMPSVVVAIVLGFTLVSMRNLVVEAGDDAVLIEVTGHQWWWEVHYLDHDIVTANEIHIPVDRPVILRLTSADVVHSFWVPALAGKLDLLPERVNEMVLEASEPDIYRGVCAEFCGLQHTKMAFHVVAMTEPEFLDWVERASLPAAQPTTEAAERGLEVFLDAECQDCHAIEGTPADGDAAPDLTHVASRQSLAAGTLDNTAQNLEVWITRPQELKEGVDMPDIELKADEIEALVAYLETLE